MKRLLILGALSWLLLLGFSPAKADLNVSVGFDVFNSSLSPYGEWVQVDFGRAWRPHDVGYGWRPYMHGRWIWSDYGWYWASDEPFGWATFHYGRWTYDDYYGWIWLPDNVWGPAWVEWRYNDDYVGWAPLTPYARFSFDIGITVGRSWVTPMHYWNFVPCRSFASVHLNQYVQPMERTRRFFGSTRGSLNIGHDGDRVINRGVDVNFIERRGNVRISRGDVVGSTDRVGERVVRDAGRDRIEVYRPRIEGQSRNGQQQIERRSDNGINNRNSRVMPGRNDRSADVKSQRYASPQSRGTTQQKMQDQIPSRAKSDYRRFEQRQSSPPQIGRERIQQPRTRPEISQPRSKPPQRDGNRQQARPAQRTNEGRSKQRPGSG
jgi:hypothetical protein